jgi:cytochrome P450
MRHWFSDVNAFRRDPLAFLVDRGSTAVEPLVPLALGPRAIYLLTDASLIKPFLKLSEDVAAKGWLLQKLRPIVGLSSLIINGPEHRRRRGAIHKHLARGAVEGLAPQIAGEIRATLARLVLDGEFNPHDVTAPLAIRMMCIAVFGRQVLSAADEAVLVNAVKLVEADVAAEIFRTYPLWPWEAAARKKRRSAAKAMMSFVVNRVRDRASRTNALRSLEELGLSEGDLGDELLTLLLAGHHTTGSTATWLLYHMATQPKLLDEVSSEAAQLVDENGEIDVSRLSAARSTQSLVNEVLRLYPAGWWFSRETKAKLEFGGRKLSPGASVIISPWHFHHDARHWDSPFEFRLDRDYTSEAYLPFGVGPRACVGMGLARLELQLLALETAAACRFEGVSPWRAPLPKALVTLVPPPMSMRIRLAQAHRFYPVAAE